MIILKHNILKHNCFVFSIRSGNICLLKFLQKRKQHKGIISLPNTLAKYYQQDVYVNGCGDVICNKKIGFSKNSLWCMLSFLKVSMALKEVRDDTQTFCKPFFCNLSFHWTFHDVAHFFFKISCNLPMVYIYMFFLMQLYHYF